MDIKNKHPPFCVLLLLFCLIASCKKAEQNNHFSANYTVEFEEYTDTTLRPNRDKNNFIILKDLDENIIAKVKQHKLVEETEVALLKKWHSGSKFNGTLYQHFRYIDSTIFLEQQKENLAYNALLPLNIMLKREGIKKFIPTNSPEYKPIDSLTGLFTHVSLVPMCYITKADSSEWSALNHKYNTPKYDSIKNGLTKWSIHFLKTHSTKTAYKRIIAYYERVYFVFKKNYRIIQTINNDTSKTRIYYARYDGMFPQYTELFFCVEQKKDADGFVQVYITLLNPSVISLPEGFF